MRKQTRQPDFVFFGQAVLAWRETHGLSQSQVAQRGGPSDTTQSAIETKSWRSARPGQTLAKVDIGFEWPPGTAARVLYEGYDPAAEPPDNTVATPPRVSPAQPAADSLLYRRPDGLSDAQWERLKEETRDYLDYLINKTARER